MKKTEKIEELKKEFAQNAQHQFICSDGSGKPTEHHYPGCPFYVSFHDMPKKYGFEAESE